MTPFAQTRAGVARYLAGLLGALQHVDGIDVVRLDSGGPRRPWPLARDTAWYPALPPLGAPRRRLDVVHCTTYRAPLRSGVPVAVTVHDLAVLRYPQFFPAWTRLYASTLLRRVLRAAARIVAVSEFTKREVVELARVPPERIVVAPNATDERFTAEGPRATGDYVLAVGTLEPRKNLARLLEAMRRLDVELRVVGARGWGGVDVPAQADGVRWLGEVPDDELAALYRGAQCFVYPSLYEGFGLPVLEAMRSGTPVVTSTGTAMEEVAGDAAELVDPLDPESIANGIERAIARRRELVGRGLERARRFTWAAAAEANARAYREAAGR